MPVTLPAVGSSNWGDALNAAITALSNANDAQKLTAMASGSVAVSMVASDQVNQAVTFPAGRFASTPIIVATLASGSSVYIAGVGSQTVNGFTAKAFHRDGTATTVNLTINWIAVATT